MTHTAGSCPPIVKYKTPGCVKNQYLFTGCFNNFDITALTAQVLINANREWLCKTDSLLKTVV